MVSSFHVSQLKYYIPVSPIPGTFSALKKKMTAGDNILTDEVTLFFKMINLLIIKRKLEVYLKPSNATNNNDNVRINWNNLTFFVTCFDLPQSNLQKWHLF